MAKYSDKTPDEWDVLIEKWHTDATITCSLQDYLELSDAEYMRLVHSLDDEKISDKEIYEGVRQIAKDVVTEMVIRPKLFSVAMNAHIRRKK